MSAPDRPKRSPPPPEGGGAREAGSHGGGQPGAPDDPGSRKAATSGAADSASSAPLARGSDAAAQATPAGTETLPLYALMAEFADPDALVDATRLAAQRYRDDDAYAPYSVEGLPEALGFTRNRMPLVGLLGGLVGGAGAYFMQWYTAVIDYPINSGGRPLHSWPAFIPPTFELTVLGAALALFFGLWRMNRQRLNHPVFNAPDFDLASRDRFFLSIRATDPRFDAPGVRAFLEQQHAVRVIRVPLLDPDEAFAAREAGR